MCSVKILQIYISNEKSNDININQLFVQIDSCTVRYENLGSCLLGNINKYDIIITHTMFSLIQKLISNIKWDENRCKFVFCNDTCLLFNSQFRLNDRQSIKNTFTDLSFVYDENKSVIMNCINYIDQYPFGVEKDKSPESMPITNYVPQKSLLVSIGMDPMELLEYQNILSGNVIGYYDFFNDTCKNFNGEIMEDDDFEHIIFVNTLNQSVNIDRFLIMFQNKKITKIGDFSENTKIYGEDYWEPVEMASQTPIILILSAGPDMEKFWLQSKLYQQFSNNQIKHKQISYHPLSYVAKNSLYLQYPKTITFPQCINDIKNIIGNIDSQEENEAIIINIGGGIGPIGNINNMYGALVHAYLNALDVDMVIYSLNPQISIEKANRDFTYLKSKGVKEIVMFVSENAYIRRLISDGRISTFKISETEDLNNYFYLLSQHYAVFNKEQVEKGLLFDYIYNKFTNRGFD